MSDSSQPPSFADTVYHMVKNCMLDTPREDMYLQASPFSFFTLSMWMTSLRTSQNEQDRKDWKMLNRHIRLIVTNHKEVAESVYYPYESFHNYNLRGSPTGDPNDTNAAKVIVAYDDLKDGYGTVVTIRVTGLILDTMVDHLTTYYGCNVVDANGNNSLLARRTFVCDVLTHAYGCIHDLMICTAVDSEIEMVIPAPKNITTKALKHALTVEGLDKSSAYPHSGILMVFARMPVYQVTLLDAALTKDHLGLVPEDIGASASTGGTDSSLLMSLPRNLDIINTWIKHINQSGICNRATSICIRDDYLGDQRLLKVIDPIKLKSRPPCNTIYGNPNIFEFDEGVIVMEWVQYASALKTFGFIGLYSTLGTAVRIIMDEIPGNTQVICRDLMSVLYGPDPKATTTPQICELVFAHRQCDIHITNENNRSSSDNLNELYSSYASQIQQTMSCLIAEIRNLGKDKEPCITNIIFLCCFDGELDRKALVRIDGALAGDRGFFPNAKITTIN